MQSPLKAKKIEPCEQCGCLEFEMMEDDQCYCKNCQSLINVSMVIDSGIHHGHHAPVNNVGTVDRSPRSDNTMDDVPTSPYIASFSRILRVQCNHMVEHGKYGREFHGLALKVFLDLLKHQGYFSRDRVGSIDPRLLKRPDYAFLGLTRMVMRKEELDVLLRKIYKKKQDTSSRQSVVDKEEVDDCGSKQWKANGMLMNASGGHVDDGVGDVSKSNDSGDNGDDNGADELDHSQRNIDIDWNNECDGDDEKIDLGSKVSHGDFLSRNIQTDSFLKTYKITKHIGDRVRENQIKHGKLCHRHTVAILHLAGHLTEQPMMYHQIVDMINEGSLPYLNCAPLLRSHHSHPIIRPSDQTPHDHHLYSVRDVPKERDMFKTCYSIMTMLGLQIPALSSARLISAVPSVVERLCLPVESTEFVRKFMLVVDPGSLITCRSRCFYTPTMLDDAIVIICYVAVWFVSHLGGSTRSGRWDALSLCASVLNRSQESGWFKFFNVNEWEKCLKLHLLKTTPINSVSSVPLKRNFVNAFHESDRRETYRSGKNTHLVCGGLRAFDALHSTYYMRVSGDNAGQSTSYGPECQKSTRTARLPPFYERNTSIDFLLNYANYADQVTHAISLYHPSVDCREFNGHMLETYSASGVVLTRTIPTDKRLSAFVSDICPLFFTEPCRPRPYLTALWKRFMKLGD